MTRFLIAILTCLALAVPAQAKPKPKPVPKPSGLATPEVAEKQSAALQGLQEGNDRYLNKASKRLTAEERKAAAEMPQIMILSCADSRIPPEVIFDQPRGKIYTNRVLGNVVDEMSVGSLEYGARIMKIPVLVVLGHTNCSAVKMAIGEVDNPTKDLFINMENLMARLKEAVLHARAIIKERGMSKDPATLHRESVKENVRNTIRRIVELSPPMWQLQHQGKLRIVGAVYDLETGKVEWLDQ
jgi:carbonic anhydrase